MFILLHLTWACWLGSIVFFSLVVAPTVHAILERPDAARLMRAIFPRYYLFGVLCGGLAIASALVVANDLKLTVPLVIATVLSAYARQVLTPALDEARRSSDDERFGRLHVQSVRLNLVAMASLLLVGLGLALL
jgi:hypothetical protein